MLIVTGSLLYSWHVRRGIKAEETRTQQFLQQLATKKETHAVQDTGAFRDIRTLGQASTPLETDEMQTMSDDTDVFLTDDTVDVVDAFLFDNRTLADEKENAEGPVSPHGFGPYPEVPADYPIIPDWASTYDDPKQELLERTMIELWRQGVLVEGAAFKRNGLIYPTIRGTVYVKWDGDFPNVILGHPDDDFERIRSTLEAGATPAGITVLDFDEAGIDPYQFLNLQ